MLALFRTITFLVAIAQAYIFRFQLFQEDGVNYLDMSDGVLNGTWSALVNAHFCPLYPLLIGIARCLFHVPPQYEVVLIRLVNLCCFALSWLAFEFLLRTVMKLTEDEGQAEQKSAQSITSIFMYSAFIYTNLCLSGVYQDTPDYLTNAALFGSAAIVLQMHAARKVSTARFAAIGALIGLGFLAKTIALYVGIIFVAAAVLIWWQNRARLRPVAAMLAALVLTIAPYVVSLSLKSHRLTLGDSGKLACVSYLSGLSDMHARSPEFLHPSRIIRAEPPAVYEFGGIDNSTYSPWLNMSYWYEGACAHINIANVIEVMQRNSLSYLKHGICALLLTLALYGFLARKNLLEVGKIKVYWYLFAVALIGMGMYLLVIPLDFAGNTRYYSGFLALLCVACALSFTKQLKEVEVRARDLSVIFFAIALLVSCISGIGTDYEATIPAQANTQWRLAQQLQALGIRPNDKICQLGFGRGGSFRHYYFARLCGAKITADIPDSKAFWSTSDAQRQQIVQTLRKAGIIAIVQYPWSAPPAVRPATGWKWLGLGSCWVLPIRQQ